MFSAEKPFHLDHAFNVAVVPVIFLYHLIFGLSAPFYHLCEENGLQTWKNAILSV